MCNLTTLHTFTMFLKHHNRQIPELFHQNKTHKHMHTHILITSPIAGTTHKLKKEIFLLASSLQKFQPIVGSLMAGQHGTEAWQERNSPWQGRREVIKQPVFSFYSIQDKSVWLVSLIIQNSAKPINGLIQLSHKVSP